MAVNGLRVKTGIKTYPIYDENDNVIGNIRLNVTDTNMIKRVMNMKEELSNWKKPECETEAEVIAAADKLACDIVSRCLNVDAEKEIFSVVGPMTPTGDLDENGKPELFLETVVNAIIQLFEVENDAKRKKIEEETKRFLEKY